MKREQHLSDTGTRRMNDNEMVKFSTVRRRFGIRSFGFYSSFVIRHSSFSSAVAALMALVILASPALSAESPKLNVLFIAALTSAMMSTSDSAILAGASVFVTRGPDRESPS